MKPSRSIAFASAQVRAARFLDLGYPLEPWQVAALSPYLTQHIHRFGRYDLDLEKRPPELVYDLWT